MGQTERSEALTRLAAMQRWVNPLVKPEAQQWADETFSCIRRAISQRCLPAAGTAAFERLAEAVHNAWWREKERQGSADTHPDAIPYEQLSEDVKEYDRATVRTVLNALSDPED